LFRAADGTWCGIARWPNRDARENAPRFPEVEIARIAMAESIEEEFEALELTEDMNLWAAYTPR
jgi:hypothetical protein